MKLAQLGAFYCLILLVVFGSCTAAESLPYAVPGKTILPNQYIYPLDVTVAAWQSQSPAFYNPIPATPGTASVTLGPTTATFAPNGIPEAVYFDRMRQGELDPTKRLFSDVTITVTNESDLQSERPLPLIPVTDESGYELNNSYMARRLGRFTDPTSGQKRLDFYTELISNAAFAYLYPRLYLRNGETVSFSTTFNLDGPIDRITYYQGNERIQQNLTEPLRLSLDDKVTKPLVIFERKGGQGVGFFLPLRPEVRAWYHEYYTAVAVPTVDVLVTPTTQGATVTFVAKGLKATSSQPHTFDFYYWAFPTQGSPSMALYLLPGGIAAPLWSSAPVFNDPKVPGLWVEHWQNTTQTRIFQALRYYPEEGYSFVTPQHCYKGAFMVDQQSAHIWGNQASNYKGLNFSSEVNPFTVRHVQLYLDKADRTGLPPYRFTCATQYGDFAGLYNLDLVNNYHSAQEAEYTVQTVLNFVKSGVPSPEDQQKIAAVINRTLRLLDPLNKDITSNAIVLPDGSYWYTYNEMEAQRVREGVLPEPLFVNNIHVTWLNVIIDAILLNRHVRNEAGYAAWLEYMRKGIDGLIYVLNQERAWADYDRNELLYGINTTGPNTSYAQYMLYGWLPDVMKFAYEELEGYRLAEQVAILRRIMQGKWTQQAAYKNAYTTAQTWLQTYLYPKDQAAPQTKLMVNGSTPDRVNGALDITADSEITLFSTDNLSGVERIEVSFNGTKWAAYTKPMRFPSGQRALYFRAVDYAGQVEEAHSVLFHIK